MINRKFLPVFLILLSLSSVQSCSEKVKALCQCELWFSGLNLKCSNVNFTDLVSVLEATNTPIQKLQLHNSSIPVLEKQAFGSLIIKHLDLADNGMTSISDGAFYSQLEGIEGIAVTNNSLKDFPKLGKMPKLASLDLTGNELTEIPEGTFDQTPKLKILRLERNKICTLTRNALNETKQFLELLDLSDNCFKDIPAQNLRSAKKLTYLDMSNNQLTDLTAQQFMTLPSLKEVRLNNNKIRHFSPLSFMNVPNLQHLYLRYNELYELEPNRFQGFQKLELLDLTGNKITKIKSSAFKEVMSLKQLFLDENRIESVETLAFSSNPKLQMISMQENKIDTLYRNAFESCNQMVILLLGNNSLPSINRGVFEGMKNLQQLNLRSNKIATIESGAFDAVPKLTTLDLGQNELSVVPETAFKSLKKLFWLDLCCNGIETFKEGTFTQKVANILLHENSLQCNESLDWFIKYLVTFNVRTFLPGQPNIVCEGPLQYEGVRLKELMIKKANESLYQTFNNLIPGGLTKGVTNGPLMSSLLPNLNSFLGGSGVPGLNSPITSLPTGLGSVLKGVTNNVPGMGLLNSAFGGLGRTDEGGPGAPDPIENFVGPLSKLVTGQQPLATDVTDLIASLPKFINEMPQTGGIDITKLSPEIIQHVLRGGQIPGIPKATLDRMVQNYLQQMARAAQEANAGKTNPETTTYLPPITSLPKEMITKVVSGDVLPGLTASQTEAIKAHYAKQLTTTAGTTSGGPSLITGIPADELLNRLPADFDLGRLPAEILQQVAAGETPDLSLLPDDIIEELKLANPDLIAQLRSKDEGKTTGNILDNLPPTKDLIQPTYKPYNIGDLDMQTELVGEENDNKVAMYTGIGLAAIGVVTAVIVAYFCYRRRVQGNPGIVDRTSFFAPTSSSPKSFDSIIGPSPKSSASGDGGLLPTHFQAPNISPITAQFDPYVIRQPTWVYKGYGTPDGFPLPPRGRTEM